MAKTNLTKTLQAIKGQIENSAPENVKRLIPDVSAVTDGTFAAVITDEVQKDLKTLAKKVGVKYQGKALEIWEGEGAFGCRLPSIYSNGKTAVINWAGQIVPLSGEVPGSFIGSEFRLDCPSASLRLPVRLDWSNDAEKQKAEESLGDLETWEEVAFLLKIQAEWLKREQLFDGSIQTIKVLDAASKEGPTGFYWALTGDSGDKVFKFSMPDKADPKVGDVVTVDAEAKTLTLNGVTYESIHFVKVTELEVGKTYQAIQLKEKTGQYPGWTLSIPGIGLVDGNSQINRWIENTGIAPDMVNKDHPISIHVLEVKKGNNGKMTARLTLDLLDDSVGLAALIGGTPSKAKVEEPSEPAADEPETEIEPEVPALFDGANTDAPPSPADDDDWI